MRWRTETEVKSGKGQFVCSAKKCEEISNLRTWEMNFAYKEENIKKNALIKLSKQNWLYNIYFSDNFCNFTGLCHDCSYKLNYKSKKRQIKRIRKKKSEKITPNVENNTVNSPVTDSSDLPDEKNEDSVWKTAPSIVSDDKQQENEFEEYLEDLFL